MLPLGGVGYISITQHGKYTCETWEHETDRYGGAHDVEGRTTVADRDVHIIVLHFM